MWDHAANINGCRGEHARIPWNIWSRAAPIALRRNGCPTAPGCSAINALISCSSFERSFSIPILISRYTPPFCKSKLYRNPSARWAPFEKDQICCAQSDPNVRVRNAWYPSSQKQLSNKNNTKTTRTNRSFKQQCGYMWKSGGNHLEIKWDHRGQPELKHPEMYKRKWRLDKIEYA